MGSLSCLEAEAEAEAAVGSRSASYRCCDSCHFPMSLQPLGHCQLRIAGTYESKRDSERLRRVVLQPHSWSGEDIFFARGLPGTVFVSERFKSLCEDGRYSNCWF